MAKDIQVEKSQGMIEIAKRCASGSTVKPWAERHRDKQVSPKTPKIGK